MLSHPVIDSILFNPFVINIIRRASYCPSISVDVANLAEVQESKLVYTIGEDEEQCVYIVADALVVSFEARLVIEAVVEMANKAI
jgi:hypothetical protein